MTNVDLIFALDTEEADWWGETIKRYRKSLVKEPREYTNEILSEMAVTIEVLKNDVDNILKVTREKVWQKYLIDEANFHTEVLSHLVESREVPKDILSKLISNKILSKDFTELDLETLTKKVAKIVGEYTGRVMPYIYALSLSTTNSRRSRSGQTFEQILEAFFDIYQYKYENQSSLGRVFFQESGLGKKVDLIVPGAEAYTKDRSKCAVVTAKTSLRERWQEVAEELQRTSVPHIYLLTADDKVTANTVSIIANYNITLVVYKSEKETKFANNNRVKDFQSFFNTEIPHIVSYWTE